MKGKLFTGSGVALVTPFTDGMDRLDYDTYGRLIDWHVEEGTDAIIAFGTTGEPSTITPKEKLSGAAFAIERAAGRVQVVVGAGGNDTRRTIEQARRIERMGADGLLVVTPYYNKTTQEGLYAHYMAVADAVNTPIIMYNVPSRTGLNMLPETAARLAAHENIAGLKEASADISQIAEAARLIEGKLQLYSGNDDHIVPVLSLGGVGVISVVANVVPRLVHELVESFLAREIERSRQIQFRINPLNKALFTEVNPIPVKEAVRLLGFGNGLLRMPLIPASEACKEQIAREMKKLGLTS